jgi:hypothetical protein
MNRLSILLLVVLSSLLNLSARAHAQVPIFPVLECMESCQRFERDGTCKHRSSCLKQGDCMTATTCESFDFFGVCKDERVTKTCAVASCPGYPVPAPQFPISCESACQKRNSHGDCVYSTSCEITGRCVQITDCERFNTFGDTCLSERIVHACY